MEKNKLAVNSAINTLMENNTVKTEGNIFKKVIAELRVKYKSLIEGNSVNINYKDFEITLS